MQIELGKIVGVWGVKGWVKLHSYTRNRSDIADYSKWWIDPVRKIESLDTDVALEVQECRQQGKGLVAKLPGIESREQAERLIGARILVAKSDLPKLPEGEFYWQQLIGLQVGTLAGVALGRVSSILETGANDVLVIQQKDAPDVLIPYTKQVVVSVDLDAAEMTVDWDPAFLLE